MRQILAQLHFLVPLQRNGMINREMEEIQHHVQQPILTESMALVV